MKSKQELIKKGHSILDGAGLSAEDLELWKGVLLQAPTINLVLFVDAFGKNKELLLLTTDMLKKKIAAGTDTGKILNLVSEEEEAIRKAFEIQS
ncbi:MAG: hypothetical protein A3H69_05230 [Candidatus Sungbacteria bacterium RIFCSPLOWO2_02_FULL_47_9]|uniref:Uncharacterized protein n=1 Tax=Candidatus Sungbacteria bacterium RIFCSPHIGHO2_01_FULL_47_32 TaxID=1802264 RepID=A0A1G2KAM8_9BACT|nr:MAG: hypothetical protein UX72_C0008G0031 [Parcubacteria group bacterium GW2011_GWA2_47_10]OGZ95581.1 MAG: hypothetical protein A2633_06625 [Candidatus Sungbacteria bacterium RIFCSPHIGHO2_01_FULL_47_32]OHA06322.1 MAG: hypothetical protein A3A28_04615 [Candidatus Sungbacteria bacterium RIFCSPLOWO2_01_FULL_47_32]OHA10099.1 MAG: hypothetical protein A3H69_05230 [Candidatus Sungbacteria bacterium RIFCSPLOWO2_02_FULL_47_9]